MRLRRLPPLQVTRPDDGARTVDRCIACRTFLDVLKTHAYIHTHVVSSFKTSSESFLFSISQGAILRCLIINYCFCIYHDQTCRVTYLANPISFSEARLTIAMYIVRKKINERGGCRHSVSDRQGDRMGIKNSSVPRDIREYCMRTLSRRE